MLIHLNKIDDKFLRKLTYGTVGEDMYKKKKIVLTIMNILDAE